MHIIFMMVTLLFSSVLFAKPVEHIVVFGDSLSDNGNLYEYMKHQFPPNPPYFNGRFSNGPVWVEQLASLCFPKQANTRLIDYAFGGAAVWEDKDTKPDPSLFTLESEVDSYLLAHAHKFRANDLYVIWIGSNNYLAMPEDNEKTTEQVIASISKDLHRLVAKGARNILVVNLPDLGKTPAAFDFEASERLSHDAAHHNSLLKAQVEAMKIAYPEVRWVYMEVDELLRDAINFPEKYGFSPEHVLGTCYDSEADEAPSSKTMIHMAARLKTNRTWLKQDACAGYLFFDPVHPTTKAHQIMAHLAKALLDKAGFQFAS